MTSSPSRSATWIAALAGAVVLAAAMPGALAGGGGASRGAGAHADGSLPLGGRGLERMARELSLTTAQQQTLRGIYESARPEMEQTARLVRENTERLRKITPDDPSYQSVVAQVARTSGELATRAVTNRAQLRAQTWAVLTPEQRTRWQSLQTERRERFQERREQRRMRMSQGPAAPAPR